MFLDDFHCILINYALTSQYQDLQYYLLLNFILLTNLVKGVQFLKYTFLSFVSAAIAAASAPCPMTVIFSLTKTYASL